jgi:hypothetical protein
MNKTGPAETFVSIEDELNRREQLGVDRERERCAEIVQMARMGEIDQDWRAVIHFIEGGLSVEQIKAL